MPFFDTYNSQYDDENQKKGSPYGQALGQPAAGGDLSGGLQQYFNTSGPTASTSAGQVMGPSQASTNKPSDSGSPDIPNEASGSDFVNYGQYWNANKDVANQQAQGIANQVGGNANAAQTGLSDLYGHFTNDVGSSVPGFDDTYVVKPGQGDNQTTIGYDYNKLNTRLANSQKKNSPLFNGAPTLTEQASASPASVGQSEDPLRPTVLWEGDSARINPNSAAGINGTRPDLTPTGQAIDRGMLGQLANQQYTGPTDFSQYKGFGDAAAKAQGAQDQLDALQSKNGLSGYLQKEFGGSVPGYGGPESGSRELDSMLLNSAGHGKFAGLGQQYAGLGQQANKDVAEGQGIVDNAKADTQAVADRYKGLVDQYDTTEQGRSDANAAKAKADAEYNAAHKKDENYFDYTNNNRGESTVRDVGEMMDPVADIFRGIGWKTPEQWANEKFFDKPKDGGLNSDKIRFNSQNLPGIPEDQYQYIYDSMTPAEVKDAEQMPASQQSQWILKRYKELKDQGKVK